MKAYATKNPEKRDASAINSVSSPQRDRHLAPQVADNRPVATQLRQWQEAASTTTQALQFADNRPEALAQLKQRENLPAHPIQLKKPDRKNRSSMSTHDREARREARYASTTGGGTVEFQNKEGRLPTAPKGTHYIETDSGRGQEDRGKRRIVSLVEDKDGRVLRQYSTYDHYETFSEIR